jgi:Tol biopolymer transport system component
MGDVLLSLSTDDPGKPIVKLARSKKRPGRWLVISAGILIILIAGAVLAWIQNNKSSYLIPNRVERQLTFFGDTTSPAWSPDGRYIAYQTGQGIYVSPSEGGASRHLDSPFCQNCYAWDWTPDSRAVLIHCICNGDFFIARLGINGEEPQVVADSAIFPGISPDGKKMLFRSHAKATEWSLMELDLASGEKRVMAKPLKERTSVYKGLYSPNGKKISFIRWNGQGHELWVMNRDGSDEHRIDTDPIQVGGHYGWAPDSKSFIMTGKLGHAWYVWNVALNHKRHIRLTFGSEGGRQVCAAPDGKSFAFHKEQDVSRICIIDVQSKSKSYPVDLDIGTRYPAFSANSTDLYFMTSVNGHWQIWRQNLHEPGAPHTVVKAKEQSCYVPVVASDGNILYVRTNISQENPHGLVDWSQTIWEASADGGIQANLARAGDRVQRIAPTPYQNNHLLYSVNITMNDEKICVLPPEPEREPIVLFSDSDKSRCSTFDWWHKPGKVIIAHSDSINVDNQRIISAFDVKTKIRKIVCHLDTLQVDGERGIPGRIGAIALSPDKQNIAMLIGGPKNQVILYNILERKATEIAEFTGRAIPSYLVWSHDNRHLAVEMWRTTTDIFVSEPMTYAITKN